MVYFLKHSYFAMFININSSITHTSLGQVLKDEDLALCGIKLHILPHGYRFDMKTRKALV
jgi:cyanophycinase